MNAAATPPPVYFPPEPVKKFRFFRFSLKGTLKDMNEPMHWVEEFINQNDFVDDDQIARFRKVSNEYKSQLQKAKRGFWSSYLDRQGKIDADLLWDDLLALKRDLKDLGTDMVLKAASNRNKQRAMGENMSNHFPSPASDGFSYVLPKSAHPSSDGLD
ncbi:hypothetical protein FRB95_012038 [Tulasnella sp. JGI-2019a]|nr:hypothetical protein FRB95_012038 [Tulasnella sp. JGI-2019a]